jgi:purine-binding chemotaxis protein CheW
MNAQEICTFFLNDTCFGIDIKDIQEVIRPLPLTRIPLAAPDICGLMNLRGQVIPVVDLPCRLGLRSPIPAIDTQEQAGYHIIVNAADDVVGFTVDDIGDVLPCSMANIEPPPATLNAQMRFFLQGAYKIDRIDDIQNTIASAVEEQTATTNEISRNVAEAAKGSADIAQNISVVAQNAQTTTTGASNTSQAAMELAQMAVNLQKIVSQFRI